jgi:hypothetical protein
MPRFSLLLLLLLLAVAAVGVHIAAERDMMKGCIYYINGSFVKSEGAHVFGAT